MVDWSPTTRVLRMTTLEGMNGAAHCSTYYMYMNLACVMFRRLFITFQFFYNLSDWYELLLWRKYAFLTVTSLVVPVAILPLLFENINFPNKNIENVETDTEKYLKSFWRHIFEKNWTNVREQSYVIINTNLIERNSVSWKIDCPFKHSRRENNAQTSGTRHPIV